MRSKSTLDSLKEELERLTLASNKIKSLINDLEEDIKINEDKHYERIARDREGKTIHVGDKVKFLTKGKYKSTQGIVKRFSKNKDRVFAIDLYDNEVPRLTKNVLVLDE